MTIEPNQFEVHPSSGVPIYLQIIEQVLALIVGNHLREGDMLPSVRQMAEALGVNPMTISKAYSRLEQDNIVERIRGKGMAVKPQQLVGSDQQRLAEIRPVLQAAIVRARQLGLQNKQIISVIHQLLKEIPS